MLARDWRAGELRVLAMALVIAVAAITSVAFFADRIGQGLARDAHQLLASLTALENVMLPLELANDADAEARAREILGRVGLGERLHHYPRVLSGGEQQRVALARAFVVRPMLLLADEPTGSLDADSGAEVITLLFEMNREFGTTLVLVTHDEGLAKRCSRIVRLAGGRIVA